ncbi:MAG: outer membrane beta-barrel protein [Nibricoccus sp.]
MNRTTILTGLAVLACALPLTQAAGPAFIRPTVAYVMPEAEGYDDAGYIGVSAGVALGKTGQHEISGEIGGTGWDFDERIGSGRVKGEENYAPVLASYRYYFQPADAKVRFFVSPSVGFTGASYEVEVSGPGVFQKDDSTELLFTLAASAGVDFRINDRFSINAGYRYLYIDSGNTELLGSNISFDETKASVIFAALNIRF